MREKKKFRSSIGGQAVMEGVMMRGERSMATAVRNPDGEVVVESKRFTPVKEKNIVFRIPFLRGVINFVMSMVTGVQTLMRSVVVYGDDIESEEPGKFEKWLAKTFRTDIMHVAMVIAVVLGLALSITLFFVLPNLATGWILEWSGAQLHPIVKNLIDGLIRICIFVAYIAIVSLMKDIRRVFMYHGAEHKTISCFEHGLPLTVENVQKQSTIHDRCGTTFMFLVMVISVFFFSLTGWDNGNVFLRIVYRLLLLPVIAGVSYEILKFLARFDNWFVRIIKAPGLVLQKLTTRQPSDDMVEVAIKAFETVQAMDKNLEIPEVMFDVNIPMRKTMSDVDKILKEVKAEKSETDWIVCHVLQKKRGDLLLIPSVTKEKYNAIIALAEKRKESGQPLAYVLGESEFYGYKLKTDARALVPRSETELLAEAAIEEIKKKGHTRILDLCTGSGAIAIVLKKELPSLSVTASDVSSDALALAQENALMQQCEIELLQSNLFERIDKEFDLLVSNPPYVKREDIPSLQNEVRKEPVCALDGGEDGLDFYRAIVKDSHVKSGGSVLFECGEGQARAIAEMMKADFKDVKIKKDYQNIERIVMGVKK